MRWTPAIPRGSSVPPPWSCSWPCRGWSCFMAGWLGRATCCRSWRSARASPAWPRCCGWPAPTASRSRATAGFSAIWMDTHRHRAAGQGDPRAAGERSSGIRSHGPLGTRRERLSDGTVKVGWGTSREDRDTGADDSRPAVSSGQGTGEFRWRL